ncbi:MAG TPA: glycosyltransferase family 2 protein [Bryobacteraceae bacterium]|nr:glycosyltransferase family 2 protein [Bryobacteraceae bacterium]
MLLSVVIPIYNEAKTIPFLVPALRLVLDTLGCDHEVVFINDGSNDESLDLLQALASRDFRLKVFSFSRNFGHQAAITAGLDFALGDAVVVMDADLQDPPEVLRSMLARYKEGYDVVSAQRVHREGDGVFKRWTARGFYWLMKSMVDERLIPEVGDFRLFSREALVAIRSFREQHRFMRGLVSWLGLKEAIVPFERRSRVAGETKYPLWRMLRFAWTAISSFSALPLRISTVLGFSLCVAGFLYFLYVLYSALIQHAVVPGWTTLVALQCLFSGVTLLGLGLVGDYVARIYEESKNRPLYVVNRVVNASVLPGRVRRAVVLPRCEVGEADATPAKQSVQTAELGALSAGLAKPVAEYASVAAPRLSDRD